MATDPVVGKGARRPILLAVDGEAHSDAAVAEAARLARALDRSVRVLHVEDTYLKQFANEIYAQGREEYLAHVECCLGEEGRDAVCAARARLQEEGIESEAVVLRGEPFDALRAELAATAYDLLIVGRNPRWSGRRRRLRDLPARLAAAGIPTPLLIVPGDPTGAQDGLFVGEPQATEVVHVVDQHDAVVDNDAHEDEQPDLGSLNPLGG